MEKQLTLDDVLTQFNPYHSERGRDDLNAALATNSDKREAFNDLFITIMDHEHEDVRDWDEQRWRKVVCFAQDFNNFLRTLDKYYRERRQTNKA